MGVVAVAFHILALMQVHLMNERSRTLFAEDQCVPQAVAPDLLRLGFLHISLFSEIFFQDDFLLMCFDFNKLRHKAIWVCNRYKIDVPV